MWFVCRQFTIFPPCFAQLKKVSLVSTAFWSDLCLSLVKRSSYHIFSVSVSEVPFHPWFCVCFYRYFVVFFYSESNHFQPLTEFCLFITYKNSKQINCYLFLFVMPFSARKCFYKNTKHENYLQKIEKKLFPCYLFLQYNLYLIVFKPNFEYRTLINKLHKF